MNEITERRYMSGKELAEALGVSKDTIIKNNPVPEDWIILFQIIFYSQSSLCQCQK